MLNRLYIVVGSLLILILGAAFIVPHFVDWTNRRPQMEALASEALGREVTIAGDISFVLLPQPQLKFSQVIVGPPDAPIVRADAVTADFSLMDFLRDRFAITHLVVNAPTIQLDIDETGHLVAPIRLPKTVSASNVSIADASFTGGTLDLTDHRTGHSWTVSKVDGSLKLTALRGPFAITGQGEFEGRTYQLRVTTSPMNAQGAMQVASFVQPADEKFSINVDGVLQTGDNPEVKGKMHFQMAPPPAAPDAQGVRGNLTLDSDITASADKVLLPNYVLVPDENRSATRLTGAAVLQLGAESNFDIVMSGGVVGLTPRDAREQKGAQPYELFKLIDELPAPFIPPLPGRIGVDISELDLRAFSLRSVRLDATSDGKSWAVSGMSGKLPGDTDLKLSGRLEADRDLPRFHGRLTLGSDRLDALAQMWRKPVDDNPLFGVSGSLGADLTLDGGTLAISDGALVLDGVHNKVSATIEGEGALAVSAQMGALDPLQSRMVLALLPDLAPQGAFGASFHKGQFDLSAEQATIDGLDGRQLVAQGSWDDKGIRFSQLSAASLGGASFTLSAGVSGTLAAPQATASGRVILSPDAKGAFLAAVYRQLSVPEDVKEQIARLLPLNVQVSLDPATEKGEQYLSVEGRAADQRLAVRARFSQGLANAIKSPLGLRLELAGEAPAQLAATLGIPVLLPQSGRARFVALIEGTPANSVDAQLTLDTDADKLQYSGNLILSDLADIRGKGQIEFDLPDPEVWAAILGASNLYGPHLKGVGQLNFSGGASQALTALRLDAGGASVTGELTRTAGAGVPLIAGKIHIDRVELAQLAVLFGSGSALIGGADNVWPNGPFASDPTPRGSRGRVSVQIAQVVADDEHRLSGVRFETSWDEKSTRLRAGEAQLGAGKINFDLSFCCTTGDGDRQVNGRLSLTDVAVSMLAPRATAQFLAANLDGSVQFGGTGASIADVVAGASGSGSFSARNLSVAGMAPNAFAKVAQTQNILELDVGALAKVANNALEAGSFAAPAMSGVLNLAGGKLRAANLAAENGTARLFGGVDVDLPTLGVSGNWEMTPVAPNDPGGLINETTALITARLGGTLLAPTRTLDLQTMADAIKVRALEIEVDRLQKLQAEKEARDKAAAAERARLMAIEARRKAEEAAAKAEAEQKARDEAAAKAAAAIAARTASAPKSSGLGSELGSGLGSAPKFAELLRIMGLNQAPLVHTRAPAPGPIPLVPEAPIDLTLGQ